MKKIILEEVSDFVKENIDSFHKSRLLSLESTDLKSLLKKKNPYLFRSKNILTSEELIKSFLDAKLSSSEEEIFGGFLEDLAIFVAWKTLGASKSATTGIDFEYTKKGMRYLVTVKSGINWGNSSQWAALESNYKNAIKILRQSKHITKIQCVLGVSYGKSPTVLKKGFILQVCGQNFWYLISGEESFYTEIIEPLGNKAQEHNLLFNAKKAEIINKFTREFSTEFCDKSGKILWSKLVEYNSKNMTEQDRKDFS